jgi:hypothetical protein
LEEGGGPARGAAMSCNSTGGGGVSCSSVAADPSTDPGGSVVGPLVSAPSYPNPVTPLPRYGAVLADFFNGSSKQVLLFGGADSTGHVYNDTWQFNLNSQTWWDVSLYQHCSFSTCPSARHDAAGLLDPVDREVIVFGGCSMPSPAYTESLPGCDRSHLLGDTWTYSDPSGGVGSWTLLSPTSSPSPRYAAAVAQDPSTGGLLLFGGCGTSCPLSDTWAFSNGYGYWKNVSSSVGTPPSSRFGSMMAYSSNPNHQPNPLQGALLFGGCGSVASGCDAGLGVLGDTWELDGSTGTWHLVFAASSCSPNLLCPPGRFMSAYGSLSGSGSSGTAIVIYGGANGNGTVLGDATEAGAFGWWSYEIGYGAWSRSAHPGTPHAATAWSGPFPLGPPFPRYDGMLVNTTCDGLAMFGGSSMTGSSLGDMWWDGQTTCGTVHGLLSPRPMPSPEYGGSMVYDALDGYDVEFGGCGGNCSNGTTWTYTSGAAVPWNSLWPTVNTQNSPQARMNASMVYYDDAQSFRGVILFGGVNSTGVLLGDTWTFSGGVWNQQSIPGPSPRQAAAAAFIPSAGGGPFMLLFGGRGATGALGDTWKLQRSGQFWLWTALSPLHPPSSRSGASMAYDAKDLYTVLFGGCGSTCPLGDTWTFSAGNWARVGGSQVPSARYGGGMVWDANDNYAFLVGGCGASTCPLSDAWSFATGQWTQRSALPGNAGRFGPAVSYDGPGSYVLVVGGMGPNNALEPGPGWAYQSGAWVPFAQSNQIPRFEPTVAPRYLMSLAYNSSGGSVLLFGGCQNTGFGSCGPNSGNDTWLFINGTWSEDTAAGCSGCAPSPRYAASMTYDARDGYFLLVGGCPASSVTCTASSVYGDYWAFRSSWQKLGTGPFGARADASIAYDEKDSVVVLFGGIGCGGICGDGWYYQGGAWTSIPGATHPAARDGAPMVYDGYVGAQYVVLTGGFGSGGTVYSDTWSYTVAAGWSRLSSNGGVGVYDAGVTYDPVNQEVVLYGGGLSSGATTGAMWAYQSGGVWTKIILSPPQPGVASLGPRVGLGMAFDAELGPEGIVVLFGGCVGGDGQSPGQGNTWEYPNGGSPMWSEATLAT